MACDPGKTDGMPHYAGRHIQKGSQNECSVLVQLGYCNVVTQVCFKCIHFLRFLTTQQLTLEHCFWIVLDEADQMMQVCRSFAGLECYMAHC